MPQTAITRGYALALLLIAGMILVVGIFVKTRQEAAQPVRSPGEIQRLDQLTQERRLQDLSHYLGNAAERVAPSLLYLRSQHQTAVIWDGQGSVMTASWSTYLPDQVSASRENGQQTVLHMRPAAIGTPVTLLTANEKGSASLKLKRPVELNTGDWVIAVARDSTEELVYTHGLYHGTVTVRCGGASYEQLQSSFMLSHTFLGGGLFTLDGQLIGLITKCKEEIVILSKESIAKIMAQPISPNTLLERRYGMRIAEQGGIQVNAVWEGMPAAAAGIQAGDLLRALDGSPVRSVADLASLTTGSTGHRLQFQRDRKTVSVELGVVDLNRIATPVQTAEGLTLFQNPSNEKVMISGVQTGSAAERAGILPGDTLQRIGSASVHDLQSITALLQNNKKRPWWLERNGMVFEVFLQP